MRYIALFLLLTVGVLAQDTRPVMGRKSRGIGASLRRVSSWGCIGRLSIGTFHRHLSRYMQSHAGSVSRSRANSHRAIEQKYSTNLVNRGHDGSNRKRQS